nr:unnamed protein product [Callosobruchus analis]
MFLNSLNNITWSDIYEVNTNDVNAQWEKFSCIFHSVYDLNFPLKKVWNSDRKKKYHDKDTEVIRCKKELNILYTASLLNSTYKDQYKQKRKEYNMTLINCKKKEYNRKILQSDNKNKTVWQIVKEINGKVNHQLQMVTDLELRTTADKYNKFLVESVEGLSRLENVIYNCQFDSNSTSMFVEPVDRNEIYDIAKYLKNKRSSGEDEVSIKCTNGGYDTMLHGKCLDATARVVVITKEEFRCKNCIGVGQGHKETMDVKLLQKEVDCLSRERHLLEKYVSELESSNRVLKSKMPSVSMSASTANFLPHFSTGHSYAQAVKTVNTSAVLVIKSAGKNMENSKLE